MSRKSQSSRTPSSSSRRRAPTPSRTIMATEIGISWSSSTKSYGDGRITEIPEFCIRYYGKTKIHRGSEHYLGTRWQSTGIAKWSKLYERLWGFFEDAESIRIGNSHVTSRPVSFPPHPIPEGMSRHSFVTPSRIEGPPSIWDTHGISGNVLQIQMRHHQHLVHKNCINGIHRSKSRSIRPQWRKVKGKNKTKFWDASLDRQPKIQSSSVEETLQIIMGQTNNDCRFRIFILTNSLHQPRLLAGRQDSRPRYVLIHKSQRKLCDGSKKWRWLIQWMI